MIRLVATGLVIAAVAIFGGVLALRGAGAGASVGGAEPGDAPGSATAARRIVATDGAVTEIVYALGFGDEVVAVDTTAQWPERARAKPSIGYVRTLSAEGVLSVEPTLILNTSNTGPPEVLAQLRAAGPSIVDVDPAAAAAAGWPRLAHRIAKTAEALGAEDQGAALAEAVHADLNAVADAVADLDKPRTLVLFNPVGDRLLVGGADTEAAATLAILGLPNAAGEVTDWKPFASESLLVAQPELIILATRLPKTWATASSILGPHGLEQTPAGAERRVILVDPVRFMAGGPRRGLAVRDLARSIYPELELPASASRPWFNRVEAGDDPEANAAREASAEPADG